MKNNPSITYAESRTINIGNYENIKTFLSFSDEIKTVSGHSLIDISESKSANIDTDRKKIARKLIKDVNSILDKREYKIRKFFSEFTELDGFISEEKSPLKIIKKDGKKVLASKRRFE